MKYHPIQTLIPSRQTGFSHAIQSGFTLIELMIVVVVIAILSAIAIPSYSDYILRGRLTDATNALAAMQAQMERYFQDERTYKSVGNIHPPCASPPKVGSFTLSCDNPAPDDSTYTVAATGSGQTQGFVYTINQQGVRATLSTGWRGTADACASAWIVKKGQPCN
jgi:type IV pilus assembly protein PilE